MYYRTPELNEKLYLHYKGFHTIKNLEQFTDLKCLYFEGNGCKKLAGLEKNVKLRCLFIQENVITTIEGLDTLTDLRQLDLSSNIISHVQGLEKLTILDNLNLKGNKLGQTKDSCVDCIKGLLDCPSITTVDLSQNFLKDPALVDEVLCKMPNLKVLYCQGNPFVNKVPSYRKALIVKIPELMYLDDRPVFPEDRRRAEAYVKGGWDEERIEMKKIKKEKEDEYNANHEAFRLMIDDVKKQKAKE